MHGTIEEHKPVQEEHKRSRHLRDVDIEVGVLTVTFENLR